MMEMILDAGILPKPLAGLSPAGRVKVQLEGGAVRLIPIGPGEPADCIAKLRGSCPDGKLTVAKFMARKHADLDLEP
jgi:hypothetical protein